MARGGGDPKRTLKIATEVSPIALETILLIVTEDGSQGPHSARCGVTEPGGVKDRHGEPQPLSGRGGLGVQGSQQDIRRRWLRRLMVGGAGLSPGSTNQPLGFQLTSLSHRPPKTTTPPRIQAPTR